MTSAKQNPSPLWSNTSKRIVLLLLFGFILLVTYRFKLLLLPLSIAILIAYLVEPLAKGLTHKTPLSRTWSIVIIYLSIIAILISIPVGTITPLVMQGIAFANYTPAYIQQIGEFFQDPIVIAEGIIIPVDQLLLDQAFNSLSSNLVDIVQTLGSQTFTIFGNVATATLSTIGWIILTLIFSFYLVKDHDKLFQFVIDKTPPDYHEDVYDLSAAISQTWHAFLRGQLLLCGVVGLLVFVMALLLGLPNAAILGIVAGVMELIPTFGPIIAAIPAVLIAFVQADASWLGSLMSPFWFAVLIAVIYLLIYQFENYYLVPRIIGHHLQLHPLIIIIGVVAGASFAGILGVLLAAPVMASLRHIFRYIYCKLLDEPPFPDVALQPELASSDTAVSPSTNKEAPTLTLSTDATKRTNQR